MAEDLRMVLLQLRGKAELEDDVDFLRQGVRAMAQQLMEMDVAQHVRAEKYERGANRCGEHNGYRDRNWDSRVAASRCASGMCEIVGITQRCLSRPALRPRVSRGRAGGPRQRGQHPARRRSGQSARHDRDLKEQGQPVVPGARYRRGAISDTQARWDLCVLPAPTPRLSR